MAPALIRPTIQAAILSATSNILAQIFKAGREGRAISLDLVPVFQFALFALLNTPPNVLWQDYLENAFPAYTMQTYVEHTQRTARSNAPREVMWREEIRTAKRLDKRNTAIKFLLDQTLGALVNTIVFLAVMSAMRGMHTPDVVAKVKSDTWPLMTAGYKVWPLFSLLSFTVIPVQHRVVFGSLAGVGWGIFLSLFASH